MPAGKPHYRLGMASIAIIALLAMPGAAVAVDSKVTQQLKHYADCIGWLLTDLAMHEQNCTPSRPFEFPDANALDPRTIRLVTTSAWSDSAPPSSGEESNVPSSTEESTEEPCNPELDPYCSPA